MTNVTGYEYDGLSRLKTVTQPGNIKTSYGYDSNDDLITVTDDNKNATIYKYDDMGRVYQVISPDTGTTTYSYDPAGNMATKKDAMGVTINYSYDALNRLTTIDFPTDTDVLYTYDNCTNGKGRLCGVTDASGTTSYEYTAKGQVTKEMKVIDGVTYGTNYTYNGNGDVTSITYLGARVVTYNYVTGILNGVTTTQGETITTLASNMTYQAFGGIKSLAYGNGLNRTITYDNQGRVGTIVTGGVQNVTYAYDANLNVTAITDNLPTARNKTYGYDALDRLTDATGPWGPLNYTYDGVGNRKTETTGIGTTNYTYTANKLMSSTGEKALTFGYDNNGNTTSENSRQYNYNQNQRLIKAAEATGALGEYVYNANGQRAKKTVGGSTTVFHFDNGGRLIAETDNNGNVQAQYVYLNGQPIAKIESGSVNYIHTDHLGTPVLMTDSTGLKIWEIESKPFGDDAGITGVANLNVRFPGQYYDAETGLHYNYFRDYSPMLGRYVEADPIGLRGGLNFYSYSNNSAINWTDPWGLWVTSGHNMIIDRFVEEFHPSLAPQYILAIMAGSEYVDTFQDPKYSYMHYMRDGKTNQSIETAMKLMHQFIDYHLKEYKCNLSRGNVTTAYRELGMALHPVMDSTAPPHSLLPWTGIFPLINLAAHGTSEVAGPSQLQIQTTVKRMMDTLYRKNY
jgi:RHS repeat-associated protein